MALHVELVDDLDRLVELAPAWDDLALRHGLPAMMRPSFCLPWWRHQGRGRLAVPVALDGGGTLRGLIPLHQRSVLGRDVTRWIGHGHGTIGEAVVGDEPAVVDALWAALAEPGRVLDLRHVRHAGRGLDELRRCDALAAHAVLEDPAPFVDLTTASCVDDLLADRRSLRKRLGRADRLAERAGLVPTFELVEPADVAGFDAPALVERLRPVHRAAAGERAHLDLFDDPARAALLVDLLEEAVTARSVVVQVLDVDGRARAFNLFLRSGDQLSGWVTAFDPAIGEISPGQLMLREACRWGIERGISTIDLQIGDDDYKRRWSSGSVDAVRVLAAHDGLHRARALVEALEVVHAGRRAALGVVDGLRARSAA